MNVKSYYSILLLSLLLFSAQRSLAQFYSAGQDPASLRWLQINTENFQVIFPQGYEQQGRYIADVLEWSYEHASKSLEHQPRKISVIVHNQTTVSNGFVSWAPRRIELYGTPPSNNDHHDWMERLVIHEFRHVVQIDKLNQGLTRLLGILFGEVGTGAVVAHLPLWFLEGDAVATETALTSAGRGRLPRFEQGLRAQVLTKGRHSFDKAVFGSYKEFVPNYYELGYQLVASARAEYGAHAWAPMLDNVARRPLGLYPFSAEMRRQFGRGKAGFYNHSFRNLEQKWTEQHENINYSTVNRVNLPQKLHTNYLYPRWINDSLLVALKTGIRDIPTVVTIDLEGNEEVLFRPGSVFPNSFDYAAGKVVWSEYKPDPRWEHRNYAEILIYNIYTGERERITRKGKFFSPALSADGNQIAAVEISPEGNNSLVIISAITGEEVWRFSYDNNDFIMQPAWHHQGAKITLVALDSKGKRLEEIITEHKVSQTLLYIEDADISSPQYMGEDVIFNATWSGIDNIYIYRRRTALAEKLVSSEFGAVNASANSTNTLAFSDYTSNGYQLTTLEARNFERKPLKDVEDHSIAFHKILAEQENAKISPEKITPVSHEIKPYSRVKNLFYLHSWVPAHINVDLMEIEPGASLLFQNKLSTSFAQLGYKWDMNEETGRYAGQYSYHGWYPVVGVIAESGDRHLYYLTVEDELRRFRFKENNYRLSISLPLRYQHKQFFYGVTPLFRIGINDAARSPRTPDSIFVGNNRYFQFEPTRFYTQEYRLLAYRQRRSVARDIFPRQAQILDFNYRHTPLGEWDMGSVFSMRGTVFFPGLIRHHGLRLSGAYQDRKRGVNEQKAETLPIIYNFGNIIGYPRGISGQNHRRLGTFSADYAFPLLYPDISIPYLLYLKRLRTALFYDHALARPFPERSTKSGMQNETLYSWGFSLTGDMHILGIYAPIALGVQTAFTSTNEYAIQLIFNVTF